MLWSYSCAREKQNGKAYGPTVCRYRSVLGGGTPGGQPPGGLIGGGGGSTGGSGMVGGGARGLTRKVLRQAFGNRSSSTCASLEGASAVCAISGGKCKFASITTPFRAATVSGDPEGTINTPAASCLQRVNHVTGTNAGLTFTRAKKQLGGGVRSTKGGALWTGNGRYVYDGSDYARFKRLQAQNRNYNDSSFGGSAPSNAFIALARVRGRGTLP